MVFRSSPISWIRSTLMHLLGPESTGEGFVPLNCNEPASEGPAQTAGDRAQKTGQPHSLLRSQQPQRYSWCCSRQPVAMFVPVSGPTSPQALLPPMLSPAIWALSRPGGCRPRWLHGDLRERTSAPSAPTPLCFSRQLILFFYDDQALQGEGDAEVCWEGGSAFSLGESAVLRRLQRTFLGDNTSTHVRWYEAPSRWLPCTRVCMRAQGRVFSKGKCRV